MQWKFESAVVPVTGAASGIGLAICRMLRAEGAVPVLLDVDPDRLAGAVAEVYGDGTDRDRFGHVLNVCDSQAVDACFERIRAQHGPISHAVANAGVSGPGSLLEITDEQWQRVMDVNLNGVMYVGRAAARQLAEARRGSIVNIASISGLAAKRHRVAYTSSKAAVVNLTRASAMDMGEYGVRVNGIAPGVIETPFQLLNARGVVEKLASRSALARLGTVDEIASVALFLMSDLASYVTGHTLVADGGLTINYA